MLGLEVECWGVEVSETAVLGFVYLRQPWASPPRMVFLLLVRMIVCLVELEFAVTYGVVLFLRQLARLGLVQGRVSQDHL